MTQVPTLLTVKQVGLRLNASGDAVRAWCRDGKLVLHVGDVVNRAIKLPSGEFRIPVVIVEAIERGEFNPDAPRYADVSTGWPTAASGDAA